MCDQYTRACESMLANIRFSFFFFFFIQAKYFIVMYVDFAKRSSRNIRRRSKEIYLFENNKAVRTSANLSLVFRREIRFFLPIILSAFLMFPLITSRVSIGPTIKLYNTTKYKIRLVRHISNSRISWFKDPPPF